MCLSLYDYQSTSFNNSTFQWRLERILILFSFPKMYEVSVDKMSIAIYLYLFINICNTKGQFLDHLIIISHEHLLSRICTEVSHLTVGCMFTTPLQLSDISRRQISEMYTNIQKTTSEIWTLEQESKRSLILVTIIGNFALFPKQWRTIEKTL